jgi:hypothetical protein
MVPLFSQLFIYLSSIALAFIFSKEKDPKSNGWLNNFLDVHNIVDQTFTQKKPHLEAEF